MPRTMTVIETGISNVVIGRVSKTCIDNTFMIYSTYQYKKVSIE